MTEATVALAGVTFVLAVAAFINIVLTWRIQARERRDRQLREVADWAVNARKASFLVETPRALPELATFEQSAMQRFLQDLALSHLAEESRQVRLILAAGEYTRSLAQQLDGSLASAVEDALGKLTDHDSLLMDGLAKLSEVSFNLLPELFRSVTASLSQSSQRVHDSAKEVLSRVTKLLAT